MLPEIPLCYVQFRQSSVWLSTSAIVSYVVRIDAYINVNFCDGDIQLSQLCLVYDIPLKDTLSERFKDFTGFPERLIASLPIISSLEVQYLIYFLRLPFKIQLFYALSASQPFILSDNLLSLIRPSTIFCFIIQEVISCLFNLLIISLMSILQVIITDRAEVIQSKCLAALITHVFK